MRVKCLAQEHNTMPWPGLEPGPLDPESSALTTRPPRLPPLYERGTFLVKSCKVEPRFNEPLFNEVLDITNDILSRPKLQ